MPTEIDRIHYLLDKFEDHSNTLKGLSYLADFLSYIDDIKNGNYDEQNKRIATNLFLTLKKRIALEINKIMASPIDCPYEIIDYWSNVLNEYVDSGLDDNIEMKSWQETVLKLKENARWESLSEKQQEEGILLLLKGKTKEEIKELIKKLEKFPESGSDSDNERENLK
ncbi:MAG: hypothetical protein A2X54_06680 [Nitrospirae bacterium GWF2_44_13]|nr:MAG: hypothetical protein A2X54_06680 [Nitrospirae bacterium GWF2_44_13]OGW63860.1 MAG: hypothetical protein A2222_08135 [Nitrospirae bacterium RIFOXYA2_FULL_44_9]HBG92065.1 hypothetical protein [Nitrospiraceae bacterium]HBU05027.1 hypothetical protein [Nitrospiraceae bacterium]